MYTMLLKVKMIQWPNDMVKVHVHCFSSILHGLKSIESCNIYFAFQVHLLGRIMD